MKTIEEGARIFCNIKQDLILDEKERYYKDYQMYDGFKAGVEFAQKWIPVEEDLPNSDETGPGSVTSEVVLAKSEELEKEVTVYSHLVNKTWHIYPSGKIITITHWRPIEYK